MGRRGEKNQNVKRKQWGQQQTERKNCTEAAEKEGKETNTEII